MAYCCNYSIYNKDKKLVTASRADACYRHYFLSISEYDTIEIFVLKDYSFNARYKSGNILLFSEEDMQMFVNHLKEAGFVFEVDFNSKCNIDYKEIDAYKFTINITEIGSRTTQLLMMILRHLYEIEYGKRYPYDSKRLLQYLNEKPAEVSFWNVLAMQILPEYYTGHSFGCSYELLKPMTKEEFNKEFIDNKNKSTMLQGSLPKTKSVEKGEREAFANLFRSEETTFEIVYKKYLELCEKYS